MITPPDILAQGFLPQAAIDAGEKLLTALGKQQIEVTAAFWLLEGEPEEPDSVGWRLYLTLPLVDEVGRLETYRQIQKVVDKQNRRWVVPLDMITVTSPSDLFVLAFFRTFDTATPERSFRYSGPALAGHYVHQALIHRAPEGALHPVRLSR